MPGTSHLLVEIGWFAAYEIGDPMDSNTEKSFGDGWSHRTELLKIGQCYQVAAPLLVGLAPHCGVKFFRCEVGQIDQSDSRTTQ